MSINKAIVIASGEIERIQSGDYLSADSLGSGSTGAGAKVLLDNNTYTDAESTVTLATDLTTTTNTLQTATNLVFAMAANSHYYFYGNIHVGCNNTGGVNFAATIPTGATIFISEIGFSTSGTVFTSSAIILSNTLSGVNFCTANNANGRIQINGTVITSSTAGNIQFQFAAGVSTQTATLFRLGTFINMKKIS